MARAPHRRVRSALPAHVTRAIGPSPARAEPHDAAAWFPVPDPHRLPTIEVLLQQAADGDAQVIDLVALEAWVSPSPARAEPHDAAAWLPLPDDVHVLPPVEDLLDPDPEVQAAVVAEAEAVIRDALAAAEAVVAPSPARAEPHDPTSWFPLPSVDELPPVEALLDTIAAPAVGRQRGRRLVRLVPSSRVLLVTALVAATVLAGGWAGSKLLAPAGSQVSLLVDGTRRDIRTEVKTVGALLAHHHVHLGPGDSVTPSVDTALRDGLRIDVFRAFSVTVDVDGSVRTVRTSEPSAEGLGKQLELSKLVAVRKSPKRLTAGSTIVFRTRVTGSLAVDGQTVMFDSPSRTVDELLRSYKVQLVGDDFVEPSRDSVLSDGAKVTVVRVGAETVQETATIPFDTVQQPEPNLPIGQTRDVQAGKNGIATITYRQRVENGAAADRMAVSYVPTVAPIPRIIGYGTQADWHWDALAQCESGGRWDTIDPAPNGFDGGLGIYRPNWKAFGGFEFAPNAGLATREQQIIVGMRMYEKYGWDPWGCARNVLHWT